jgi:hypothetical protein
MGSALTMERVPPTQVQLSLPDVQSLSLLASDVECPHNELIVAPPVALTRVPTSTQVAVVKPQVAPVLSPSQVRTFLDCQARWWFKYGLQLPEPKNSSLALGLAIHRALEVNFREKLETHEDLDTAGVVMLFRDAWMEHVGQAEFMPDESQHDLRRLGERLVAKYMDEVAPAIEPAAVEMDVQGQIAGIAVRGRVDLLDVEGRLIDIKTAARKPSWVSAELCLSTGHLPADHARCKRRGAHRFAGEDHHSANCATALYGRAGGSSQHSGIVSAGPAGHGFTHVLSEPAVAPMQPEVLRFLETLPAGVRRQGPAVVIA